MSEDVGEDMNSVFGSFLAHELAQSDVGEGGKEVVIRGVMQ
jgi:hypothetical protein